MAVAIEVSFFSATQKLTNEDRGRVLTFVNKFLENPAQPSLSLERVQQARSDNVWSARVSRELRAILFRDGEDCVLVYVDHHDDAYQWAAGRSIARHNRTGALQIIALPTLNATGATAVSVPRQGLFANYSDEYLHSLGVPQVWLPTLRQIRSEDELIEVLQKLPQDVAERLCDVAAGRLVTPPTPISALSAAVEHADQGRAISSWSAAAMTCARCSMHRWPCGLPFYIRRKENSRTALLMAQPRLPVLPAPARRSWPCTGPGIWHNRVSVCC